MQMARFVVLVQGHCYSEPCQGISLITDAGPTTVGRSQYYEGLMGCKSYISSHSDFTNIHPICCCAAVGFAARWESLGWLAFINFCYVIFLLLATRFISHQKK